MNAGWTPDGSSVIYAIRRLTIPPRFTNVGGLRIKN
jgi:hypothetical protein